MLYHRRTEIGYCVVSQGGNPRYPFANKHDIIVGPLFISPEYRGHRLSIRLISKIVDEFEQSYSNAYAFIQKGNDISVKAFKRCGFQYYADARYSLFRILKENNNTGDFALYRYKPSRP